MVLCLVSPFFFPRLTACTSSSRACASLPSSKAVRASRFRSSIFREAWSVLAQALRARTHASERERQRWIIDALLLERAPIARSARKARQYHMCRGLVASGGDLYHRAHVAGDFAG